MNMPDFANRLIAGPPRVCCPACDKAMGLKPPALGDNVRHETCRMHLEMMRNEALRLQNIMAAEEAMGKEGRG